MKNRFALALVSVFLGPSNLPAPGYPTGGGARDCTLINCILSGNAAYPGADTGGRGGGASHCTLTNCILSGNSAVFGWAGGASESTLYNCTLTGNWADWGGGACGGILYNCTVAGNSASYGGGAYGAPDYPCALNNCIVYFNTATNGSNYADSDEGYPVYLNYSCTTPQPSNGFGNITNVPLFVDYAGGNLRLQSNSPCINAGLNASAPGPADLDGLPRIVSGTVDIGAYEFQGSGSVISYAWLQQYGLPTDGSSDAVDLDSDGLNTWQEWRCLTDPTTALSALRVLSATSTGTPPGGVTVTWQSVAGVNYFLERSTDLIQSSPFTPLVSGIPGQDGTTSYTDTDVAGLEPLFYRVGVGD